MKKLKARHFFIKIIFFILIILLAYLFYFYNHDNILPFNFKKAIICNQNYSGIGQQKINNNENYNYTFTTIDSNKKTYIEYKQNGTFSWANKKYWDGTMKDNGCGITALSIILSGYNKQYTPEDLRQKYYPALNSENISSELTKTYNIKNSGFYFDTSHLSNKSIIEHLNSNRPILVCIWNEPKSNRWTTSSHYMVLLATDNNNMVYVSNPNGLENTNKSSGWYNINEITPYLAKALYIEDYK